MAFIKDRLKLQEYHDYATSKGGLFLSTECVYSHTKTLWQCDKGHQWEARFNSIKNGTWCPRCSGKMKITIEQLQEHAKSKNGKLISTTYKNSNTKLLWECEKLHQFELNWNSIQSRQTWCSECSRFKIEKLCKEILEKLLKCEFKKKRFNFGGQQFEFDGYNEERKIAFEYHGIQHYEFPNYWHKTEEEFKRNQLSDDFKEQYALENNIRLIIIPYTQNNNLEKYIQNLISQS